MKKMNTNEIGKRGEKDSKGNIIRCTGCGRLLEKNLIGKTTVCSFKCFNSREAGLFTLGVNDDL